MRCVFQKAIDPKLDRLSAQSGPTVPWTQYASPSQLQTSARPSSSPLQHLSTTLYRTLSDLSCVLSPCRCRVCDHPLRNLSLAPVCTGCLQQLRNQQHLLLCSRCGESLGMESYNFATLGRSDAPTCHDCQSHPPDFLQAAAFGTYDDNLREMLHLFKYDNITALARPLGAMLAEAIQTVIAQGNKASATAEETGTASTANRQAESAPTLELLVIPVPLYRRKRPFNQSELLAREALRHLARNDTPTTARFTPNFTALLRVRDTRSQHALTRNQRQTNLRGAFQIKDTNQIKDRQVLLIDDLYTTGATIRECTRVLLKAGAASVRVATLARAQRETVTPWHPTTKSQNINDLSSNWTASH